LFCADKPSGLPACFFVVFVLFQACVGLLAGGRQGGGGARRLPRVAGRAELPRAGCKSQEPCESLAEEPRRTKGEANPAAPGTTVKGPTPRWAWPPRPEPSTLATTTPPSHRPGLPGLHPRALRTQRRALHSQPSGTRAHSASHPCQHTPPASQRLQGTGAANPGLPPLAHLCLLLQQARHRHRAVQAEAHTQAAVLPNGAQAALQAPAREERLLAQRRVAPAR
jgi:hypothetical protein